MRKPLFVGCAFAFLFLSSCKNRSPRSSETFFDSLVTKQVEILTNENASVTKSARMGEVEDHTTLTPTHAVWENELDAFRQLGLAGKPAYKSAYEIRDRVKDPASNLLIRSYRATRNVPVMELRFFYYGNFLHVKKIEAVCRIENTLYFATRKLLLEFEDVQGTTQLTGYGMEGVQKIAPGDTVHFSIQATIHH